MRPSASRLSLLGLLIGSLFPAASFASPIPPFRSGIPGVERLPGAGREARSQDRPAPQELRIIHHGDGSTVAVRRFGGVEMVRLAEIAGALGGALRPGDGERQAVLRLGGEAIRVDAGRSFVMVGRTTRLLRNPSVRRGGEWFVPLEFVSRVLPDVLPGASRYDRAERTLVVGEGYPELEVEIGRRPGATRVTINSDPPVPMEIEEGQGGVSVSIRAGFLETSFLGEAPQDGVLERVDLYRTGEGYVLEITTGRNYGRLRQERGRGRLELDLIRAGVRAESGAAVLPVRPGDARRPRRDPVRPADIRTVAIDAGHGGDDSGTVSPGGLAEKEVALAVALALRDRLQNEYGLAVVLTRDGDRAVELDDRAAVANAARADLLIAIHLNASPSPTASGSLVYHHSPGGAGRPPAGSAVHFVPWDSAQARFASSSRALAEAIAAELEALPIPPRGIADAPLRVLAGAAMPAVQVELGFVTSAQDRQQLVRPEFNEAAARALSAGILRYRRSLSGVRQTGAVR